MRIEESEAAMGMVDKDGYPIEKTTTCAACRIHQQVLRYWRLILPSSNELTAASKLAGIKMQILHELNPCGWKLLCDMVLAEPEAAKVKYNRLEMTNFEILMKVIDRREDFGIGAPSPSPSQEYGRNHWHRELRGGRYRLVKMPPPINQ